jgi:DNA polymerase-3 subunit delta
VDALLAGKSKRAWHILQQLQQEEVEPVILLRTLQRELLLLLTLQRATAHTQQRTLFDQHKVWQNRRSLITQALQRITDLQLQQAVRLLSTIEVALKKDHQQSVWSALENLSMLICGKPLTTSFSDVN